MTDFLNAYIKAGDRVVILHGNLDYIGKLGRVITVIGLGAIVEIGENRAGFPLAWLCPETSEQTSEHAQRLESLEQGTLTSRLKMFGSCDGSEQRPTHWTAKYYVARGWFFRYYWMEYCDRKQRVITKHKHIRGGNIHSEAAQRNRKRVEEAIAAGWLPHQIVAMIASWPKSKRSKPDPETLYESGL